ncbi:phytanoyl-CoA dioxygenase family protein [Novosphingobium sp. KN65.2]|uniref:phytanoyl-CoA dioxygenase family protein n=1 Tax=Novosphingobium sp. KN65.2 TaxID=1478134 RepID=UPI0005DFCEDF|nr:phytanoyl-CoA dioxygenase family protein [Novosphingobium sp. KN65.2]CDO35907.1 putative Protein involved in biosynthesis of mitomycin antibiotics/polyketide fumonisin [Novosphingobium sp. KN65.2]
MSGETIVDPGVRAVTDEEVRFFFENGWVKLERLISRDYAAQLLKGAKGLFGDDGNAPNDEPELPEGYRWFRTHVGLGDSDPHYRALATSPTLGRNFARLFGRESSIRKMRDSLLLKHPAGGVMAEPTRYHQDTLQNFFSEANTLNIWLALDEVRPEQGALRFYSRSHKLGNLGNLLNPEIWEGWASCLEEHCTLTDPIHLLPGDVTVHSHFTIHGTGANSSPHPRWSWGALYLPGDARYTGAQSPFTDGLGLEAFGPLDHPAFPIIYSPGVRHAE